MNTIKYNLTLNSERTPLSHECS